MGLIAVSGQPGCRFEEVARITAHRLEFELVTASRIAGLVDQEFALQNVPDKAYLDLIASIVARLATNHHLVVCGDGLELLAKLLPGMLRVHIVAPDAVRVGNVMLDERLERPAARQAIREMENRQRAQRKQRFGQAGLPAHLFDLILNAEQLEPEQIAELVINAARSAGLIEQGFLSAAAEAQLQFRCRLRLSKHGIVPPDKIALPRKSFAHPSEEIFANLLDFYRIAWEYEPRSFPIQWDRDGKVAEAFTPDFYLPEFDLYVELTTMKQSLVTRKNRKVKLLREVYPHVNIQVFYQKDFENLIFKYGLAERAVKV
ncbi:MAG TPA: cytidylate kinase family protein [Bryobacteraceae bacterium]|nr:cytidylate kinase family protein [Bryobacteraceae bacterium]